MNCGSRNSLNAHSLPSKRFSQMACCPSLGKRDSDLCVEDLAMSDPSKPTPRELAEEFIAASANDVDPNCGRPAFDPGTN